MRTKFKSLIAKKICILSAINTVNTQIREHLLKSMGFDKMGKAAVVPMVGSASRMDCLRSLGFTIEL